jgi:diguanylate cyclase (GGDEF)-like protein
VYSDLNIKMIALLFVLSITAFISHRSGIMDTAFPVLINSSDNPRKLITSKGTNAFLEASKGITLQCQLSVPDVYNFCGVGIALNNGNIKHGVDLSEYTKLQLTIKYHAPNEANKLKISFRNYNENYSTIEDSVSLKFNSISYNPNLSESTVTIPFAALKVDSWWVEQYNIDFNNSQVDLSNVSYIEILTDSIHDVGDYRIEIQSVVLYGEIISEANLLKLLLVIWLISIIFFITLQRNKLKRMSIMDPLTGLYNRQGIGIWTNKKILLRGFQHKLIMFYLDLDDFKKINDTYGHQVGDQLLIAFCQKIQCYLDSTLHHDFSFARLSGDEFTLVIHDLKDNELNKFSENLLAVLDYPIILDTYHINVRASLGIAKLSDDVKTFEDLLARADSAMYYAKKEGKNRYKIFNASVSEDIFFRKRISEILKDAIIEDDFQLNFMPIIDSH